MVLVTGAGIDTKLLAPLEERHNLKVLHLPGPLDEARLGDHLRRHVRAYLHGGEERATGGVLRKAGALKVIAFVGVGYENFIDVPTADELNIAVTNTPGAATDAVAAFTVGQIINANWLIPHHLGPPVPGWKNPGEMPHELGARRVGILGMGANGRRIAEILCDGFHATVTYHSRTRRADFERKRKGRLCYRGSVSELAEVSDILVVMVPETDETRSMIDSSVIDLMPRGSVIVNTARPAIVDPYALYAGLRDERVRMAVFDGFYDPDSDIGSKLRRDFGDRLLVTGHIASHTQETMNRMITQAVASIDNYLTNGTDQYEVGNRRDKCGEAPRVTCGQSS
ncbi:D-isomer specific 2-hydroxyacid dehydrogenase family protein [Microbispora amethystogenes]|uniref:D-isomer specific 2-hydroxyacid dehydrogenase n=2 Tax=Microbispora amethystogenes TaxID=1427754 RepID=A0ABQ4FBB0_9ACTN|nr:D-isomer specific 2-hydroxyacid dehydrogenase [Microbispora amethystogenes]